MELTDENFDHVIQGESVAVVGFGAPWCGNCRNFFPVLEEAVGETELPFHRLIVDDNPQTLKRFDVHPVPVRYDVRGVPTVVVFEGGQEKGRFVGAFSKDEVVSRIREIIG